MMIEKACQFAKPVRIGVNWGSLDQAMLARLMDDNAKLPEPLDAAPVMHEAIVQSGVSSAKRADELGLGADHIIISAKVSEVQDLIAVYRELARRCDYALHLGLTEAGMGSKGIVASTAALSVLLQEGIGDTIRISLTPEPGGDRTPRGDGRPGDSADHGVALLHAHGHCLPGLRTHHLDGVSGARPGYPDLHAQPHAGVAEGLSRLRDAAARGHGLHRQWAGRIEARRYRDFTAWHRRGPRRPGLSSTARR